MNACIDKRRCNLRCILKAFKFQHSTYFFQSRRNVLTETKYVELILVNAYNQVRINGKKINGKSWTILNDMFEETWHNFFICIYMNVLMLKKLIGGAILHALCYPVENWKKKIRQITVFDLLVSEIINKLCWRNKLSVNVWDLGLSAC